MSSQRSQPVPPPLKLTRENWFRFSWSFVLGGLDFAGGSPVHISSESFSKHYLADRPLCLIRKQLLLFVPSKTSPGGTASFAISIYLGKRRGYGTEKLAYKPHSTFFVILGTVLLWLGWQASCSLLLHTTLWFTNDPSSFQTGLVRFPSCQMS